MPSRLFALIAQGLLMETSNGHTLWALNTNFILDTVDALLFSLSLLFTTRWDVWVFWVLQSATDTGCTPGGQRAPR
jgi:hypothetical protein